MTLLIVLLVIAGALVAASIRTVLNEDRGHTRPPVSHREDPAFLPPSRLAH